MRQSEITAFISHMRFLESQVDLYGAKCTENTYNMDVNIHDEHAFYNFLDHFNADLDKVLKYYMKSEPSLRMNPHEQDS